MKLKLNVENDRGDVTSVVVKPRTQVAFERHFSTPDKPVRLDDGVGMEHLYWLAWHALKVQTEFDDWLDTIDSVTADVDEGDEVDGPLAGTPPSGTSLPQPSNQEPVSRSNS